MEVFQCLYLESCHISPSGEKQMWRDLRGEKRFKLIFDKILSQSSYKTTPSETVLCCYSAVRRLETQ